ncbi:MAG: alanine racemase [Patescibacteria group bacterium]
MKLLTEKSWVEISASALLRNVKAVERLVDPANVMAVVKANAYGHGLEQVVSMLEDRAKISWYGVDAIEEALAIRRMGVKTPVLVLGYIPPARLAEAIQADISFVVYDVATITTAAETATAKHPARVHLKVETGLMRQGVHPDDLLKLVRKVKSEEHVWMEGVSTHYANIEDTDSPAFAHKQLEAYREALDVLEQEGILPAWRHTACSAAALLYPETRFDLIRFGIGLYGLWSSEKTKLAMQRLDPHFTLSPVLTWKTVIAQVKRASAGTAVSYGLTQRVKRDSVLAVLPVGYADGFDRVAMSGAGEVGIKGTRCSVIGRVCMNMCIADVTDVPGVKAGDEVVLIGDGGTGPTAEEFAGRMKSINYEVVARINPFVKRIVTK